MRRRSRFLLREQTVLSRQVVGGEAHHDLRLKEVVNVLTPEDVWVAIKAEFGFVVTGIRWLEQGEVMINSRGTGVLQKIGVP